jgi:hypothetical protein
MSTKDEESNLLQLVAAVRQELAALQDKNAAASYSDAELRAFLLMSNNCPLASAAAVVAAAAFKTAPGPHTYASVGIRDISAFLRASPGAVNPAACIVCLEDGKGGVARDVEGRPIVVTIGGMVYGSALEMKLQTLYAIKRAELYCLPENGHAPGETCAILEVMPRTSSDSTAFRFPDANSRVIFDMMRHIFPASQLSAVHFCGVPRIVLAMFHLCRPFLSAELNKRLILKSGFSHLKGKHIAPENMLSVWDPSGTFDFDLDEYVEWRAREEGVAEHEICPRGMGRQYYASMAELPISAAHLLRGGDQVVKHGPARKQGSGLGILSSRKWKTKLLVLCPTVLFYFDSLAVTDKNKASRIIPLDAGCTVTIADKDNSMLCVHTAGRDFLFRFECSQETLEWQEAIRSAAH